MFRTVRRFALTFSTLSLLAVGACAPQALKLEVSGQDQVTFNTLGESFAVTVAAVDRDGKGIDAPKLRWYSINPRIADVSASGLIQPKADGKTRIVVRSGYAQHEIAVHVRLFAKLEPSKRTTTLPVGGYETLTAQVLDARGEVIEDAALTWTTMNPELVEVSHDGTLVGLKKGTAQVVVSAKNLSVPIEIQVLSSEDAPSI